MWWALALSFLFVAYNNLINRWEPFHGAAYVPLNLTLVGVVTLLTASTLGLSPSELGLEADIGDLAVPVAALAVFAVGAFTLARSRYGHHVVDKRVAALRGRALAFYVLIRIPLGTALAEEALFRGALFAAWTTAGSSTVDAALCASLAFGLWHICPTIIGVRTDDPAASRRKIWIASTGAVFLTTIVGFSLTWLRVWSGGLLAPIVVHAGVNSLSALSAVLAHHHLGEENAQVKFVHRTNTC